MKSQIVPVLGVAAWSGTGKTTLLTKIVPVLKLNGLRVALIKHAHHQFDVDHPGKDSHKLRKAGADQVVIASNNRVVTICEVPEREEEVTLEDILANIQFERLDLILVEGFKMAAIPKIELHRQCLRKPYLYKTDKNVIALAHDRPDTSLPENMSSLNLNDSDGIAKFVLQWVNNQQAVFSVSNAPPTLKFSINGSQHTTAQGALAQA